MLEALEQVNMFIIPLDRERRWYRYHHLFADVLNRRLEQLIHVYFPICTVGRPNGTSKTDCSLMPSGMLSWRTTWIVLLSCSSRTVACCSCAVK